MSARGSVLVQVLILSLLMAYLAALILKMTMHQATSATHAISASDAMHSSQSALLAVHSAWNLNGGQLCGSYTWSPSDQVACAGAPLGSCGCTCSVTSGGAASPMVTTSGSAADCETRVAYSY